MKYKIISFDMQETLTDSSFSDEFWMETLPYLYSKSKSISLDESKAILKEKFSKYGKYDYRYYSVKYWIEELDLKMDFSDIVKMIKNKPLFYKDVKELLKSLKDKVKLIIISTTTYEFIDCELGEHKQYFDKIYSSLDDFDIAGKTKEVYEKVAKENNVLPSEILHIGDSKEMDVENADKAGCDVFFFNNSRSRDENIKELKKLIKNSI